MNDEPSEYDRLVSKCIALKYWGSPLNIDELADDISKALVEMRNHIVGFDGSTNWMRSEAAQNIASKSFNLALHHSTKRELAEKQAAERTADIINLLKSVVQLAPDRNTVVNELWLKYIKETENEKNKTDNTEHPQLQQSLRCEEVPQADER